ncbi:MAG: sigma-70 family RNA polymerase sigma factor [Clostridia bacterium]|nr:sigma-70 family RNA polymerase sigma factor [Clostridia bacterium]
MVDRERNPMDYEEFYSANYIKVVRYLGRKCANFHDAEDLAHECFLYCYKHWNEYNPAKASVTTWLFLVVRSRWKNYLRDHKEFSTLEGLEEVIPGEGDMDRAVWLQSLRNELASLLKNLPEKQREAIVLRYFEQWEDADIANRLNTSQVNVRVLIYRGLQKMNREFSEYLRKVAL